jgi:hypothetical protein
MSALQDEGRSAIALHVAVLRRRGLPVERALLLVASRLPPGVAERSVGPALAALSRGEPLAPGADPLVALLARGDAAPVESLDEAVRAEGLARDARAAGRAALAGRSALAATVVFVLFVLAFVLEPGWQPLAALGPQPAPTVAALALLGSLKVVAPLLAVLLVAVWLRPGRLMRFLPGVAALERAASLRGRVAALEAGVEPAGAFSLDSVEGLDGYSRQLAARVLAEAGASAALRLLAQEEEREGRAAVARGLSTLPQWLLFIAGTLVGGLVMALYLPIFSIAGAIK